jgi:hypothetical protein
VTVISNTKHKLYQDISTWLDMAVENFIIQDGVNQTMWHDKDHKAWESKYDPSRHTPKSGPKSNLPTVDSLPEGKWVAVRNRPQMSEDFVSIDDTIIPWIKENRLKVQGRIICNMGNDPENPIRAEVFLFKKSRDAVLFKLAWG